MFINIIYNFVLHPRRPPHQKTAKIHIFAIGLLKDQLLPRHKAHIPSLLTVLQGQVAFHTEGHDL